MTTIWRSPLPGFFLPLGGFLFLPPSTISTDIAFSFFFSFPSFAAHSRFAILPVPQEPSFPPPNAPRPRRFRVGGFFFPLLSPLGARAWFPFFFFFRYASLPFPCQAMIIARFLFFLFFFPPNREIIDRRIPFLSFFVVRSSLWISFVL